MNVLTDHKEQDSIVLPNGEHVVSYFCQVFYCSLVRTAVNDMWWMAQKRNSNDHTLQNLLTKVGISNMQAACGPWPDFLHPAKPFLSYCLTT